MHSSAMIRPQAPGDTAAIDALHEEAFGPGRFARTAFRVREAATRAPLIALTTWIGEELVGAIQLSAVTIGGKRGAMLLGPLAIAPAFKNKGYGLGLMKAGLADAEALGFRLVVLVGDLPYYQRAGFRIIPPEQITLPGPVDPARFLAAEVTPRALLEFSGMVAADNAPPEVIAR